jgi:hypothetical protein
MRRILALLGLLISVGLLSSSALATTGHSSYRPNGNAKCRKGYTRDVRSVLQIQHGGKAVHVHQTWCVWQTSTTTIAKSTVGEGTYVKVAAAVFGPHERELRGLSVTITVTDKNTRRRLGSFKVASNFFAPCTVAFIDEQGTSTYTGQAESFYPACAMETISVPDAEAEAVFFTGSFAGNGTYAPSRSEEEAW